MTYAAWVWSILDQGQEDYYYLFLLKLLLLALSLFFLLHQFRRKPKTNTNTNTNRRRGRSKKQHTKPPESLIVVLSVSPACQSPRALAHAQAISQHMPGYVPIFVARAPFPPLSDPGIKTHALPFPPASAVSGNRGPLDLVRRLYAQVRTLLAGLDSVAAAYYHARPSDSDNDERPSSSNKIACILLCVPPSIPTICVTKYWMYTRTAAANNNNNDIKLLVDWHNTTASILAVHKLNRALVLVVSIIEALCKHFVDLHWCVTKAMQRSIIDNKSRESNTTSRSSITSLVLYDVPDPIFRPFDRPVSDPKPIHDLLLRVAHAAGASSRLFKPGVTPLTCGRGSRWRTDPYKIAVSSTSWTPDEDFAPLVEALQLLDPHIPVVSDDDNDGNKLLVVITGKGPLRKKFEHAIAGAKLKNILVWTAWLSREDYAQLLAVADIGFSMHQSSSGIDLPMKAVDMLGAGTPVISRNYHCIDELITAHNNNSSSSSSNKYNGILFDNAQQLKDALFELLFDDKKKSSGSKKRSRLEQMKINAANTFPHDKRWSQQWKDIALPSLLQLLEGRSR